MNGTPLFQGNLVRLTAMRPDDLPIIKGWYEDSEFIRLFDSRPAYPRGEDRLRHFVQEPSGNDAYSFGIRPLYSDDLIGIIDLDGIQWTHRVGWLSIAIGSPANRGRGYGREAIRLILRFAFQELNLHRIQLTVFSYNTSAIRLYQSLGFVHEGTYRQALQRDGERHDMLLYGMLINEWQELLRADT